MSTRALNGLENELMGIISASKPRTLDVREFTRLATYAEDSRTVAIALHQLVVDGLLRRNAAGRYELAGGNVKQLPPAVAKDRTEPTADAQIADEIQGKLRDAAGGLGAALVESFSGATMLSGQVGVGATAEPRTFGVDIDKHFLRRAPEPAAPEVAVAVAAEAAATPEIAPVLSTLVFACPCCLARVEMQLRGRP